MQEIFQAIASGLKAKVIGLLKRDPSLFQSVTEEGITPVLFSLYYGKLDISKEIYEIHPERNLFEAAALGDLEEVKKIVSNSADSINSFSKDGWSALHLAAYFGHLEVAKFLISSGADLGLTSRSKLSFGNTALHSAVATGKKAIVELLLEKGADANALQNPGGITPLHVAASRPGSLEIIQLLLKKGADKSKRSSEDQTPQAIALERGNSAEAKGVGSLINLRSDRLLKNQRMKNKNTTVFQNIIFIAVELLAFLFLSDCKVDIKQLPQPRDFSAINLAKSKETSYIGKFDVISAENYNLSGAWKYTFKTILKQNRVFYSILDLNEETSFKDGSYVLDIEVTPKYSDEYNYWWTWPSIYPFVGLWPIQVRTGEYEVRIDYTLLKADQVVKTGSIQEKDSLTLYVYGMYRTTDFEEMIETANLKAIGRCVKEISSNL